MEKMASNGFSRATRSGRTPHFLTMGLLIVICILAFNYWNVSSHSRLLQKQVKEMTQHLEDLALKKVHLEKRNDALTTQLGTSNTKNEALQREKQSCQEEKDFLTTEKEMIKGKVENAEKNYEDCNENLSQTQKEKERNGMQIEELLKAQNLTEGMTMQQLQEKEDEIASWESLFNKLQSDFTEQGAALLKAQVQLQEEQQRCINEKQAQVRQLQDLNQQLNGNPQQPAAQNNAIYPGDYNKYAYQNQQQQQQQQQFNPQFKDQPLIANLPKQVPIFQQQQQQFVNIPQNDNLQFQPISNDEQLNLQGKGSKQQLEEKENKEIISPEDKQAEGDKKEDPGIMEMEVQSPDEHGAAAREENEEDKEDEEEDQEEPSDNEEPSDAEEIPDAAEEIKDEEDLELEEDKQKEEEKLGDGVEGQSVSENQEDDEEDSSLSSSSDAESNKKEFFDDDVEQGRDPEDLNLEYQGNPMDDHDIDGGPDHMDIDIPKDEEEEAEDEDGDNEVNLANQLNPIGGQKK